MLNDMERRILSKTLQENSGNISKTAYSLGISRQNLQYRLKKLKIEFNLSDNQI